MNAPASAFTFKKATRAAARARITLIGPAGSGKTMTALRLARGLVGPEGRIAVIDSERGSATLYAGSVTDFDHLDLPDHSPTTYMNAMAAAARGKYDAVVIDSLSHAWAGKDGALEMVDEVARRSRSGNNFAAWREVTPLHNELVDQMIGCPFHLIATLRSKTKWVIEEINGKSVPRKVGLEPVQRDGVEYEFDMVADMDDRHRMTVTKARFYGVTVNGKELDACSIERPDERLGEAISEWLQGGTGEIVMSRNVAMGASRIDSGSGQQGREQPRGQSQQSQPQQQPAPQQQAPPQPSPAERIAKATGAWEALPNRPQWAEALFTALVNHAQKSPDAAAVDCLAAMFSGVRGGRAPDVIMQAPPIRNYLSKASWAVTSPAADEHGWLAALISHARSDAPADELAGRVPGSRIAAIIGELQGLPVEERAGYVATVMSVGWPFESGERPRQDGGTLVGPDGEVIPF